ncbi:unnamed protein product [Effrenium voratum]|nr:unnamed protein product [Effrenium voratum]
MGAAVRRVLGAVVGLLPLDGASSSSALVVEERMPFHNPEHSCPTRREVDWPLVKAELTFYANQPHRQRRIFASPDASFEWRVWVARIYVSNDVDFCPLGLQTVHLADVDRRVGDFDAQALAEVFEAHYLHYFTRIPFLLAALSGWPVFRIYSGLVDAARSRPDFPLAVSRGICRGEVPLGDVITAARLLSQEALPSADEAMPVLARILTKAEATSSEDLHEEDDCLLCVAFAHLGRAIVLASFPGLSRGASTSEGVERYFGKLLESVEAAEAAWHKQAELAMKRRDGDAHGLLRVFAGGWPIWHLLDRLQQLTSQRPWALQCREFHAEAPLCPACAVPMQAEWSREAQWVSALAAGGARGEMQAVVQPRLRLDSRQDMAGSLAAAAARHLERRQAREAWATLLSDDDAIANEAARRALLVYLEAVRVMARSARLGEARVASEASRPVQHRDFLVLMTEAALTDEVRRVLEGDNLTPLVLPSFSSEGIAVPSRRKQRGETGVKAEHTDEEGEPEPDAAPEVELSWWLKIKLWSLTQYRRIVYLDADTLVHRPIEELFALPDEVALAAPVHLSRDGRGSEISVGVMSLRPDRRIYGAMVDFLSAKAADFTTGVRSVDQMLQHSFFVNHFSWGGYPRWEAGSGRFAGCMEDMPALSPGLEPSATAAQALGLVCVLPPRYDFCVSYPALVAAMDSPDFQEAELAVQFPQPGETASAADSDADSGGGFRGLLRARLLHWTGPRRKPWMHYLSLARTTFDKLWWSAHEDLCREAKLIWSLGAAGWGATVTFVVIWLCRSRRCEKKILERMPILPIEVQLAKTINFFPLHICSMACACLIYPSAAFALELAMSIAASVVMGCLVQYYLLAFGRGHMATTLLEQTPEKKWWMASYCGGVNDMMPGMGLVYSRKPHQLTLTDLHRAVGLVESFMWIFILTSTLQVGFSIAPTPVSMDEDGYCVEPPVISSGLSTTILVAQVFSTFVGSAGFSIISSAAGEAFNSLDPDHGYHFKRKAGVGSTFLTLPLLKVLLGFIPLARKRATVPVGVETGRTTLPDGTYTVSWSTLECPVFDQQVGTPYIYCCAVAVIMAWLAFRQSTLYTPGESFDDLRETFKEKFGDKPALLLDSEEESDEPRA